MAYFLCGITVLLACIAGKICGMGGGVIIKPVLDSLGIMDVYTVNFISSCTVLGMSGWSLLKSKKDTYGDLDYSVIIPLSAGAAVGGIAGKQAFQIAATALAEPDAAGRVQALLLLGTTIGCFIYTLWGQILPTKRVKNIPVCILIGFVLGLLSSFLGIGGGPINMVVLLYFFSMSAKNGAINSLVIILISQIFSLSATAIAGGFPKVSFGTLVTMILLGIIGSEIGRNLNKKLTEKQVSALFRIVLVVIMGICIKNVGISL